MSIERVPLLQQGQEVPVELQEASDKHTATEAVAGGERPRLPDTLVNSLRFVTEYWRQYNSQFDEGDPRRRPESDYTFIENFYTDFFGDRIARAKDVKSDRYKEVVSRVKSNVLPTPMYLVMCIDGRVIPPMFGFTADTAGAMRVAAGEPSGFDSYADGSLFLDTNSDFAMTIADAAQRAEGNTIVENLDTHMSCLAGQDIQGKHPVFADGGLLANVHRRRQMIEASQDAVALMKLEGKIGREKNVIFTQTIFNPEPGKGHLYMGAETDAALATGRDQGGYTEEVLDELAGQGVVISTRDIAMDPVISLLFEEQKFALNWKSPHHYVESADKFWMGIETTQEEVLPLIKDRLLQIYPHLADGSSLHQQELDSRATLLHLNAFSYFLNSSHEVETTNGRHGSGALTEHIERGIKVSEGTHPPYETPMFAVYIKDKANLRANVQKARGLVVNNRKEGRISDQETLPVPAVVKWIVRKEHPLSDEKWEEIASINFSDLPSQNWMEWSDNDMNDYLLDKGLDLGRYADVARGMNELRLSMKQLYSDPETRDDLRANNIFALPVISDSSREPRMIMPFMYAGRQKPPVIERLQHSL